jgi:transketolase
MNDQTTETLDATVRRRCADALRVLAMDAVRRPTPATRACRWAWPTSRWRCGAPPEARPGRPAGPTATASCSPTATARCCCTRCCTCRATRCRSTSCKRFRQLHSKTPGHPESASRPGSRPPPARSARARQRGGHGARREAARHEFNRPGHAIVDHRTWVFLGDGCLMEGISHEACSLAGTWRLNKLVVLYDDNGISIDGEVAGWFTDDTPARFEAYGWHVIAQRRRPRRAAVDRGDRRGARPPTFARR